jgi:hypothetical protein
MYSLFMERGESKKAAVLQSAGSTVVGDKKEVPELSTMFLGRNK